MPTIYNATDGPLVIDGEGRILGGREPLEVESIDGPIAGHIDADRLVVIDGTSADDDESKPAARKAGRNKSTTTEEA